VLHFLQTSLEHDWQSTTQQSIDGDDGPLESAVFDTSVADVSETVSSGSGSCDNDITSQCATFQTPLSSTRKGASKRKVSEEMSAIDTSLSAMAKYLTARSSALLQTKPVSASPIDDETVFGAMVASEVGKIKQLAVRAKLKKAINDAIYEAQVGDMTQVIPETKCRYFMVQEDGTMAEFQLTE
jgi:hypothetical protein